MKAVNKTKGDTLQAAALIQQLALEPHPEGGHYRRVYASQVPVMCHGHSRPAVTAIQFLLGRDERSTWHRVDADEAWHWQQGGSLELQIFDPANGQLRRVHLNAAERGGPAMVLVPAGCWQTARALDDWTLVACVVSPGFVWEGFALLDTGSKVAEAISKAGGTLD